MEFIKRAFRKVFPDRNEKQIRKIKKIVIKIEELSAEYSALSNDELRAKTKFFKNELANGKTLDDILVPAFATVREAAKRVIGLYHYKVQLIGGIALHQGLMSEMKTGEGKTLVSTLPAYLNALGGKTVHIVTVNDYLAKRDSDEMGQIHKFLGLSVGCIMENMQDYERKKVYACDIVYATGSQLGFDYLKDNMKNSIEAINMRTLDFAIIDEVDSIAIDEARTPLIISGAASTQNSSYTWVSNLVSQLPDDCYEKDEKHRSITLTEAGIEKIEKLLTMEGVLENNETLYSVAHLTLVHSINQALKALFLFRCNTDYIVHGGEVKLVDELTGRILEGRRYSEGLHQALEAKERLEIQPENQTIASITYQSFFALYSKLSGMSGTCYHESEEFETIYKCSTVAIPTHRKMIRKDHNDEIYSTFKEKFNAVIQEVKKSHEKGQPVLLITGSVEISEKFSKGFMVLGLEHAILNAKKHKEEAAIIADAGKLKAITIATNMAGRGTDIQLGGHYRMQMKRLKDMGLSDAEVEAQGSNVSKEIIKEHEQVIAVGGLKVVGTERNESRRVDDQARGRAGRQGDCGESKFFLSLDDELMRRFGNIEKLRKWLVRFGLKEGEVIEHPHISKAIAKAQHEVEGYHFDQRKSVFKYDKVLDEQRRLTYSYRKTFLIEAEIMKNVEEYVQDRFEKLKQVAMEQENINYKVLHEECLRMFGISINSGEKVNFDQLQAMILKKLYEIAPEYGHQFRMVFLNVIDELWKDHLHKLDKLRQTVNLQAYAQKDPLNEYKKESFVLFEELIDNLKSTVVSFIFHLGQ